MKNYYFLQPVEGGANRGMIAQVITPDRYLVRFDVNTPRGPQQVNRVVSLDEVMQWQLFPTLTAMNGFMQGITAAEAEARKQMEAAANPPLPPTPIVREEPADTPPDNVVPIDPSKPDVN